MPNISTLLVWRIAHYIVNGNTGALRRYARRLTTKRLAQWIYDQPFYGTILWRLQ